MTHKRGGKSTGGRKGDHGPKKGGLLIGMRGGIRKAAGVRGETSGPGVGGPSALGRRLWTGVTVAILIVAFALVIRRFAGH